MDNIFEFSVTSNYLFRFFIIIAFLFLFFRIISYVLPLVFKNQRYYKLFKKYVHGIEIFVWIIFLSKAYYKLSISNQVFSIVSLIIIIILVLYFSWYALKDYVAGVIFKTCGNVYINDNVRIYKYTGKIVKFAYRTLSIETTKGEIVYIPYSKITSNSVVKMNLAEAIKSYSFKLKIKKTNSLVDTIENIKKSIINLPWSSVKKKPGVYPIEETNTNIIFDITVYAIEDDYFYNIENYIKEKFANIEE